jgi:hypothetical protein
MDPIEDISDDETIERRTSGRVRNEPADYYVEFLVGADETERRATMLRHLEHTVHDMGFHSLSDAWFQHVTDASDSLKSLFESDILHELYQRFNGLPLRLPAAEQHELFAKLCRPGVDIYRREWQSVQKDVENFKQPLSNFSDEYISEFSFDALFDNFATHAPHLVQLCEAITRKRERVSSSSEAETDKVRAKRRHIATALSILGNESSRRFNALQGRLGYACFAIKVPKRMINILNKLGLCPSYVALTDAIRANGEAALRKLSLVASRGEAFWVSFDNLHVAASVRDHRLHNKASFMVLTAGYVVIPPESRRRGFFTHSDWDWSRLSDLRFEDFLPSVESGPILSAAFKSLIWGTLRKMSGSSKGWTPPKRYPMPVVQRIDHTERSEILPLPTYDFNEGIVNEVIALHQRIAQQVGWTSEMAKEYIIPFKGDFATVEANRYFVTKVIADMLGARGSDSPKHLLDLV